MTDPTIEEELELRPEQDELAGRDDAIELGLSGLVVATAETWGAFFHPDELSLADRCAVLEAVQSLKRDAADVEQQIKNSIGHVMGGKTEVVDGYGVIHRSRRIDRTSWDKTALRMSVADSKRVDRDTGEVIDETPLDKVLHVWNLGAPRTTALRDRGLDPDEFCSSEKQPGWNIRIDAGD